MIGNAPGMRFRSVLLADGRDPSGPREAPAYFRDLNLDQIVAAITTGKEEYDLLPFFHAPLRTVEDIAYRHEVMRDLEEPRVSQAIERFASGFRTMRRRLQQSEKLSYRYQQERWFTQAAETYVRTLRTLAADLEGLPLTSRGLRAFRSHLADYTASAAFIALTSELRAVLADLGDVHYTILIKGNGFTVRRYDAEEDYTVEIAAIFEKFRQAKAKNYLATFSDDAEMNHVEAKVLDFVALLYPETFARLGAFVADHQAFADPVLQRFDREIQFYVACHAFTAKLEAAGLPFCYPEVSAAERHVYDREGFDLALAVKLVEARRPVVCNDFELSGCERILVVSGPNQGGKTTLARSFGQLHHLASLGCRIPGREARMFLPDAIYTHFERAESIETLRGKLQDDLQRVHDVLDVATPNSIIVLNEIFSSTTARDAVLLARCVLERIMALDLLCVCVTFLDELSTLGAQTVSMVSTVVPDDPTVRTFKVVRRPADGRAYAISIAEKYGLTYERIKSRVRS